MTDNIEVEIFYEHTQQRSSFFMTAETSKFSIIRNKIRELFDLENYEVTYHFNNESHAIWSGKDLRKAIEKCIYMQKQEFLLLFLTKIEEEFSFDESELEEEMEVYDIKFEDTIPVPKTPEEIEQIVATLTEEKKIIYYALLELGFNNAEQNLNLIMYHNFSLNEAIEFYSTRQA